MERRAARPADWVWACLAGLAYIALQLAVARLRLASPLLYAGISIVSLLVSLAFAVSLARSLRGTRSLVTALILTAVIVLPFMLLQVVPLVTPVQVVAASRVFRCYVAVFRAVPGLLGLLTIALAVEVGVLVSRLVREVKILLPIAVVLALVDLYVVFGGGMVAQANSGRSPAAQQAMQVLTVNLLPRPAAAPHAMQPVAAGFADYLFIALFFAAFARFGVPVRRTFLVLCGTLAVYMAAVIALRLDLPALLPIAAVVIGCHLDAFRYRRDEAFAMLYAGLLVAAILGAMTYFGRK